MKEKSKERKRDERKEWKVIEIEMEGKSGWGRSGKRYQVESLTVTS